MGNEVSAFEVSDFELFNNAANNNKSAIANELRRLLSPGSEVLEVGSGSGQHAVHFASQLDDVRWQPTDKEPYFDALENNLKRISSPAIGKPRYLDIERFDVEQRFDAVFCANVIHIMPAALLPKLMAGAARCLQPGGLFILYGPYKYNGEFTTPSNAKFDDWLKSRNPLSGIRDIEYLQSEATKCDLSLIEDQPMPANNQLIVLEKMH